jgi:hypothetical protein
MTRDDWEGLLDEDPAEPQRRLEYADWLADQGLDVEAEVQRWLAREGKRPCRVEGDSYAGSWAWWTASAVFAYSVIPAALWQLTPQQEWAVEYTKDYPRPDRKYRVYATRGDAEAALVEAWRRLKEAGGPVP